MGLFPPLLRTPPPPLPPNPISGIIRSTLPLPLALTRYHKVLCMSLYCCVFLVLRDFVFISSSANSAIASLYSLSSFPLGHIWAVCNSEGVRRKRPDGAPIEALRDNTAIVFVWEMHLDHINIIFIDLRIPIESFARCPCPIAPIVFYELGQIEIDFSTNEGMLLSMQIVVKRPFVDNGACRSQVLLCRSRVCWILRAIVARKGNGSSDHDEGQDEIFYEPHLACF
jgi:hypothetical protein